jgi:hypothetical protein
MNKKSCDTCFYYQSRDPETGFCHFNPPQLVPFPVLDTIQSPSRLRPAVGIGVQSIFPIIEKYQWCSHQHDKYENNPAAS